MTPLSRWPWRDALAFAAGGLSVTAFAPFGLFPLPALTLALLFWLWLDSSPAGAFRRGWLFGLGLLGFGVSWLHISIDQFGNVGTPLAVLATALFIVLVALLFGAAGWLARRFDAAPPVSGSIGRAQPLDETVSFIRAVFG